MKHLSLVVLIIMIINGILFSQSNNLKWQKADISYEKQIQYDKRNYSFESENAGEFVAKSITNAYWFFISDVDGDNCSFQPTCSSFFIDATIETNIFQGTLMFADRLTRDLNPSRRDNYPRMKSRHYVDPVTNYTLNQGRINYIPPIFILDDE